MSSSAQELQVYQNEKQRHSLLVGAQAKIARDGVQDIGVARGLLPDVQLHHSQPKALHLHAGTTTQRKIKDIKHCTCTQWTTTPRKIKDVKADSMASWHLGY